MRDDVIPFEQGEKLFDAASFPKQRLWLPFSGHKQAIEDQDAADAVRDFFESARPMPVI
jgi:hypothetical protein